MATIRPIDPILRTAAIEGLRPAPMNAGTTAAPRVARAAIRR